LLTLLLINKNQNNLVTGYPQLNYTMKNEKKDNFEIIKSLYSTDFLHSTLCGLERFAVCKDKKYLDKDWQKGNSYEYCEAQMKLGRANGYGLITGEIDGYGIVAVDFDGESSSIIAKAIGDWLLKDDTMKWTSGKKGHYQIAYLIPNAHLSFWKDITKHDIAHLKGYNCTNGEHLEIRYNNHASVLPESVHPETGYYKWIKQVPPRELTFAESYDLLNVCTTWQKSDISDSQELNLIEEALSYISPDDYHTWVTVGMALHHHGVDFATWDKWSQQSPKYDGKGIDAKWQSFSKISKVSIGTLFHLAKQEGFDQSQWMRQNLRSNKVALNKTLERSKDDIPEQDNGKLIKQFLDTHDDLAITPSQLAEDIALFCHQHRIPEKLIRTAIDERRKESYLQEEIKHFLDLDNLIATPKRSLDLPFLLGDELGNLFIKQAQGIPTNPDALFCLFLPAIASLIGTKQHILANEFTDFIVPYVFRVAMVADSGSAKSAVLKTATYCAEKINKRNWRKHLSELKKWELTSEKDRGEKPIIKRTVFKDFNFEGLYKALEENGHGSGLVIRDELNGYFMMITSNRTGQGDNIQKDLELFEGGQVDKLRMSDDCTYNIEMTAVSMVGCLQWSVLEKLFSHQADDSGISPRWNFFAGELPEYMLTDRVKGTSALTDKMGSLANYFENTNLPKILRISDIAYEYLQNWFNSDMRMQRLKANFIQEKSKHNKILSDCIKLAGILHNLHIALKTGLVEDVDEIGVEIMMLACYLSEFFLSQYLYCFLKCQGNLLDGQLTRILEKVEKAGEKGITASQILYAIGGSKCKLSADKIGELALQLVSLGKLKRIPTKQGVKVVFVKK
jgi:hypothetical protein